MELEMERLLTKGISLIKKHEQEIKGNWKITAKELKERQIDLVDEFDEMILYFYDHLLEAAYEQVMFSLTSIWNEKFSSSVDHNHIVFLISVVENVIHKILHAKKETTYLDHQALQYLFTKLLDQALIPMPNENSSQKLLKQILSSKLAPADWIALLKIEGDHYRVMEVVFDKACAENDPIITICKSLTADSIQHLSVALTRLLNPLHKNINIIPVMFVNEVLLLCVDSSATDSISEQHIDFISKMYKRHVKMEHLETKNDWKDASILFLQHLIHSSNKNMTDTAHTIAAGFVNYLPFERCALFIYYPNDQSGVGVYGYNIENDSIKQIKESIADIPLLKKNIELLVNSKPIYIQSAADVIPEKYVHQFKLKSLVAVPIFIPARSKLIGLILLDKGEQQFFEVTSNILATLIKFGQYAGEFLYKQWNDTVHRLQSQHSILSPRELEVLKCMTEGASIHDAAIRLNLSSYTVRDYVSSIIKKLHAKNRTEAVAIALKLKMIQ